MSQVLWLNKETLEERWLHHFFRFNNTDVWVKVPEGATFATGDKDDFVFRKDGWYYDNKNNLWFKSKVTIKNWHTHTFIDLFWVKSVIFTLERLLGCKVLFGDTLYHVHYIYYAGAVGHLVLETNTRRAYVSDLNLLTFFTEDGDELTFDEYVKMYYGGSCVQS